MAERVGFEPTCRLRDKTLSRRPRYDHFGTSPHDRSAFWSRIFKYISPRAAVRNARSGFAGSSQRTKQVNRQWKDDRRVLLGRDFVERLQISQGHRARDGVQYRRGLRQLL
jgi:hypothetical protein